MFSDCSGSATFKCLPEQWDILYVLTSIVFVGYIYLTRILSWWGGAHHGEIQDGSWIDRGDVLPTFVYVLHLNFCLHKVRDSGSWNRMSVSSGVSLEAQWVFKHRSWIDGGDVLLKFVHALHLNLCLYLLYDLGRWNRFLKSIWSLWRWLEWVLRQHASHSWTTIMKSDVIEDVTYNFMYL